MFAPLLPEHAPERSAGPAANRVLIVDDEERLLESLVKAARARGYDASGARDGEEALAYIRRDAPDLVVTDLRMPGLDGPSLMRKLQEEEDPARVVVITGYATIEAAVDCLRKGAVDFLVKPFAVEEFLQSVERALSKPAATRSRSPDWNGLRTRFCLTRREAQVLRMVYETGKSNREVGEDLCIAYETVKSHLKVAFHKLGVANRTQMIRVVREFK